MKRSSSTALILSVVALFSLPARSQQITTFDVPGGVDTNPMAISASGKITGLYGDPGSGNVRGFLRVASGKTITFDVAGMNTIPSAINAWGEIAGYYCSSPIGPCNSFLRKPGGSITAIDIPDSFDTEATAMNVWGQIAGHWTDNLNRQQAFLYSNGVATTFDVNGSFAVMPYAMNAQGQMVGFWKDDTTARGRGFLREENGTIKNIDVPASLVTDTTPYAINFKGQITGVYSLQCPFPPISGCSTSQHGFLREAQGTYKTFDVPNSQYTVAVAIDSKGVITGYYEDAIGQVLGFLRNANGSFLTFEIPNALFTVPVAMSPSGLVTGVYADAQGNEHGFTIKF